MSCCGDPVPVPYHGFEVCRNCGAAIERVYMISSYMVQEGRDVGVTQYVDKGKCLTRTDGLGSEIGYRKYIRFTSSKGTPLPPEKSEKFKRLRNNYHIPSRITSSQTHARVFMTFNRIASQLEIPNTIKERAAYVYWEHIKKHDYAKRNHILLMATCLLYAIRENGFAVSYREFVNAFRDAGHRVTNKNILKLAVELNIPLSKTVKKSEDYIEQISSRVTADRDIRERIIAQYGSPPEKYGFLLYQISQRLLAMITRKKRGTPDPYTFATSIIYQAARVIGYISQKPYLFTQKEIASITGAKEGTIRDQISRIILPIYRDHEDEFINTVKEVLKWG